jgi:transcriptional regulator GlxA family with amidase domain
MRWSDTERGDRGVRELVGAVIAARVDAADVVQEVCVRAPNIPHSPPIRPREIDVLAFPSVQLLDVTGPIQVFASANDFAIEAGANAPYLVRIVAASGDSVTASAGVALAVTPLPPADTPVDTLIIAGGHGVDVAAEDRALVDWIRARADHARRVASVCTGAFLLAATGLLDERRAATHWSVCADLARRFPAVRVESEPIFIRDGSFWTSAGVTSGIDLALALVEEDLGRAAALAVARYLVVFLKRPGGQAQFSTTLSLQAAEDEFGALHDWIGGHLAESMSLAVLARRAGMSERSFSRRYAEATGMTPGRAVEQLRVEAARRLLLESRLPMKRISRRCGFGSEETMRRSFMRLMAVSPQDYRSRFGV